MFHGIIVKPGETHQTALRMIWNITSIALDKDVTLNATEADSKNATAVCFRKDGVSFTLCTLRPRSYEQHTLDLSIEPDQPVEFSVVGKHTVHLAGVLAFADDSSDDDYSEGDVSDDDMGAAMREYAYEEDSEDDEDEEDSSDEEDDEDVDVDDSDLEEAAAQGNLSYGTLALAALAQGEALNEEDDDSDDDAEWTLASDFEDDDEDDDDEDDEETDEETDSEEDDSEMDDSSSRFEEVTEEEAQAIKRLMNGESQNGKKSKTAGAKGKTSSSNHDDNGEPLAKRKPQFESPTATPENKENQSQKAMNGKKDASQSTPSKKQQQEKEKKQQNGGDKKTEAAKGQGAAQNLGSGLTAKVIRDGSGKACKPGQRVFVRYRGRLASNNKQFDANTTGKPFSFRLGKGEVIKGWDQGVKGMKAGEVRELKVPSAMGYGARGAPPAIPGNATLLFTVELLRFK